MSILRTADAADRSPGSLAPHGTLIRDERADLVMCHLCGRWFRLLGAHVRVHGLTADDYRAAFGLFATKALSSGELSATRSQAQGTRYRRSGRTREDLARGHAMARSGELTVIAGAARQSRTVAAQRRSAQIEELAAGRRTQAARTGRRLVDALRERGFDAIGPGLRALYLERQTGLEDLASELGVGRMALRRALAEHGVPLRGPGGTTDAGRRSRTRANIATAAARVGTTDLHGWLTARRDEGWTLTRLAAALDRSVPWVRTRLADR